MLKIFLEYYFLMRLRKSLCVSCWLSTIFTLQLSIFFSFSTSFLHITAITAVKNVIWKKHDLFLKLKQYWKLYLLIPLKKFINFYSYSFDKLLFVTVYYHIALKKSLQLFNHSKRLSHLIKFCISLNLVKDYELQ